MRILISNVAYDYYTVSNPKKDCVDIREGLMIFAMCLL